MCQTTTEQPGRAIGQHPQTPQGGSPPHIPQWAHPSPAPRLIAEGRVSRCACPLSLPAHSHTIHAVETHPSIPQQESAQSPLGARCVDIVDGSHASSRTSSSATVASPRLRHAHHHAQCHHACAPVVFAMCCCLTCSTPPKRPPRISPRLLRQGGGGNRSLCRLVAPTSQQWATGSIENQTSSTVYCPSAPAHRYSLLSAIY